MEQRDLRERFDAQGFSAAWNTPEAFGAFIAAEIDKWARVVKVSGASIE